MEKKQSFLNFTVFLYFSFAVFFLIGTIGIITGRTGDVQEFQITKADTLLVPFWDYSVLHPPSILIFFIYQSVFFSFATLGVIFNWPRLILLFIMVRNVTLICGAVIAFSGADDIYSPTLLGLEGMLSTTMMFSFLVSAFLSLSLFNISSGDTKKNVYLLAIPKKMDQEV